MSKTTTAIPTIKSISNLNEDTITKLYHQAGIPQPQTVDIKKTPSFFDKIFNDKEITIEEVHHNSIAKETLKARNYASCDVIVEEVILSDYISLNFIYNKLN